MCEVILTLRPFIILIFFSMLTSFGLFAKHILTPTGKNKNGAGLSSLSTGVQRVQVTDLIFSLSVYLIIRIGYGNKETIGKVSVILCCVQVPVVLEGSLLEEGSLPSCCVLNEC